jgi:hypothetical protein
MARGGYPPAATWERLDVMSTRARLTLSLLAAWLGACSAPPLRIIDPAPSAVVPVPEPASSAPAPRSPPPPSLPLAVDTERTSDDPNVPGTTLIASSAFRDRSPPAGWSQCAGFVNTAGDDVADGFLDRCLESDRLRVRVFGPDGALEEDVFVEGIAARAIWITEYLGAGGATVKRTFWGTKEGGAPSLFLAHADGTDACMKPVGPSRSMTLGSGHAETAIIVGGAQGFDEYRVSCGKQALPNRRIALYR